MIRLWKKGPYLHFWGPPVQWGVDVKNFQKSAGHIHIKMGPDIYTGGSVQNLNVHTLLILKTGWGKNRE